MWKHSVWKPGEYFISSLEILFYYKSHNFHISGKKHMRSECHKKHEFKSIKTQQSKWNHGNFFLKNQFRISIRFFEPLGKTVTLFHGDLFWSRSQSSTSERWVKKDLLWQGLWVCFENLILAFFCLKFFSGLHYLQNRASLLRLKPRFLLKLRLWLLQGLFAQISPASMLITRNTSLSLFYQASTHWLPLPERRWGPVSRPANIITIHVFPWLNAYDWLIKMVYFKPFLISKVINVNWIFLKSKW